MKVLLWVVALVPLAVFGIVASSVGKKEGLAVLRLVDLADRGRGPRAVAPGSLVSAADGGCGADVAAGDFLRARST